jgi:iron(III) transport system ATP-binding protein
MGFGLEISNLNFSRTGKAIFESLNWKPDDLPFHVILGENGSGKSTLLNLIAGFLQPDSGHIAWKGTKIPGPKEQLIPWHPKIALLNQDNSLHQFVSVREHLFRQLQGLVPPVDQEREVNHVLKVFELHTLENRKTHQLSGGQQQRLALAGVVIRKPELLLLDEPFANLDVMQTWHTIQLLNNWISEQALKVIAVFHDARIATFLANQLTVLKDGKIVCSNTPEEMYYRPADAYAAGLLGLYNQVSQDQIFRIKGKPHILGELLFFRPENAAILPHPEGNWHFLAQRFQGDRTLVKLGCDSQVIWISSSNPIAPNANFKLEISGP